MKDRSERNYRVAECCEDCEYGEEEYNSDMDIYVHVCTVDGRKTAPWNVRDSFVHMLWASA